MPPRDDVPVPLTIIGGFLGSGKTTLLNRLLAEPRGQRFAVIVNDFGAITIDDKLITSHEGQTIALANGCVCCTIGDNFLRTLLDALKMTPTPDHIVVEASGVADPARIADIASIEKDLRLDGVIVLADASQLIAQMADSRLADTIERQVDSADLVLLNKTDLADEAALRACRGWIANRRQHLFIYDVVQANAPFELLFGMDMAPDHSSSSHKPHHIPFETLSFTSDQVVSAHSLENELRALSPHIIRAKGILQTSPSEWSLLQMVGARIEWAKTPEPADAVSQLVVIGPTPLPNTSALQAALSSATP